MAPSIDRCTTLRYRRPMRLRARRLLSASGAVLFALAVGGAAAADAPASPPVLRVEVLETYPHDPEAFTQGLLLEGGKLYESTGLYGRSSLREVELATGAVLRRVDLPKSLFGEGLALAFGKLVQLTWREGIALSYDFPTLAKTGEFTYGGDGWGLCFDGTQFIQSDGTQRLIFRDPTSFAITRQLAVTLEGKPLMSINELECVGDSVYANVWTTDRIVKISKLNGGVRAVVDAAGLLPASDRKTLAREAILNGIAYDPANETFLITGKLWPKLFRVRFVPK